MSWQWSIIIMLTELHLEAQSKVQFCAWRAAGEIERDGTVKCNGPKKQKKVNPLDIPIAARLLTNLHDALNSANWTSWSGKLYSYFWSLASLNSSCALDIPCPVVRCCCLPRENDRADRSIESQTPHHWLTICCLRVDVYPIWRRLRTKLSTLQRFQPGCPQQNKHLFHMSNIMLY